MGLGESKPAPVSDVTVKINPSNATQSSLIKHPVDAKAETAEKGFFAGIMYVVLLWYV